MGVTVAKTVEELQTQAAALEDLVAHSIEPNVFYEPWLLSLALELLCEDDVRIVHVWSGPGTDSELLGLFPLVRRFPYYRWLPFSYLSSLEHAHCFLCSPLIRSGSEGECFKRFAEWFDSGNSGGCLLELRVLRSDGALYRQLHDFFSARGRAYQQMASYERACVNTEKDPEAYMAEHMNRKTRKEMRRKFKGIREQGELEFITLTEQSALDVSIENFLSLELKGWKGRQGSALASSGSQAEFFRRACRAAFDRGQLLLQSLTLSGQPIAMKCSFVTGAAVFAFKITYDEHYSRFSPGLLLEHEHLLFLLAHPDLQWMDTCSAPEHSMCSLLASDRRRIVHINVANKSTLSGFLVSVIPHLRRTYHAFLPTSLRQPWQQSSPGA